MTISTQGDLDGLARVGRLVALTLQQMRAAVVPGVTTAGLDALAERFARARGARSAPQLTYGFPGFTCISVNEEIVHGIPGPRRVQPGDIVKLDVTLELDGLIADAAVTVLVPPVSAVARQLRKTARAAFDRAMHAARPGRPVCEIGSAVDTEVRRRGFSVVRELCGHGVGRRLHEAPSVPNFRDPDARSLLHEGLVLAVEPMATPAPVRVVEEADGWTLRTHDRSPAVHHEHTIVVRRGSPVILTAA